MKYTQKSFSVGGSSSVYSDNFDRIFRQCSAEHEVRGNMHRCELDKKHEEAHRALIDGDVFEWFDRERSAR